MERKILRKKDSRFCEVKIELVDGRLSICGAEGRIVRRAAAKKEALQNWVSFFEEEPNEIASMNERCGTRFRSATSAARYVLQEDGELHGLDVLLRHSSTGPEVMIVESCGQIRETIVEFFPEIAPLLPYHLNDMHAGCEHQDALGWGHGKTIALAESDLTDAQRDAIEAKAAAACQHKRDRALVVALERLKTDHNFRIDTVKKALNKRNLTVSDVEDLDHWLNNNTKRKARAQIEADISASIQPAKFEAEIYKDSIGAPCPNCGYFYGTAWLKRQLPTEIVKLAETVAA